MQLLGPRVLHQQLVPKRNGVHILPSCRAFQVLHRGCTAQINLKEREGSELKLIHSLLCPLGLCERDTLYQKLGRFCNLKEKVDTISFRDGLLVQLLGPRVLHQQLVPKRNGVHILPSCRAFHVFHRGCIAQISLNDRKESELKLIHSLLCLLGLCERDNPIKNLEGFAT